jgi:hypothetical protein
MIKIISTDKAYPFHARINGQPKIWLNMLNVSQIIGSLIYPTQEKG